MNLPLLLVLPLGKTLSRGELVGTLVERGWRAAGYVDDNDPDLLVVNAVEDEVLQPVTMEQIRDLAQQIALRPVRFSPRIVVIHALDASRVECQHALLKSLEEPSETNQFVVTVTQLGAILPTVQSRCEVINFATGEDTSAKVAQLENGQRWWKELQAARTDAGATFAFSDANKDRGEALKNAMDCCEYLRQELEKKPTAQLVVSLQKIQNAIRDLQANGNVRLVVEELVHSAT